MRRKYFLVILLSVVSMNSDLFAQEALKKGNYSLSGSITFTSSTNESIYGETKDLSFYMMPALVYFVVDNFSAGLSLAYGYSELSVQNKKYVSRPVSFGPVVRYYFANEKITPFLEAGYRYSNSLTGNEDMHSVSFAAGINYFLSKSVALEPYLEYRRMNYIVADQKMSSIGIGMRVNYFIVD